jgi:hypothetical protein
MMVVPMAARRAHFKLAGLAQAGPLGRRFAQRRECNRRRKNDSYRR